MMGSLGGHMRTGLLLLGLAGCKVVDAPDTLEELMVFSFVHFTDGPEYLDASAEGLAPFRHTFAEELTDGYRINSLTADRLTEAGITRERDNDVIGASGAVGMTSAVLDVATALTHPDLTEVFSSYVDYEATSDDDRACFLARDCASYTQQGSRTVGQGGFGEATQHFDMSFWWVAMPEGQEGFMVRTLAPGETEMTSAFIRIHQFYSLSLIFSDDLGTHRIEGDWVDAQFIGLDVPDSVALDQAIKSMQSQAEDIDAWVAGD